MSVNSGVGNPCESAPLARYSCWVLSVGSYLLVCLVIASCVLDIVLADLFVEII